MKDNIITTEEIMNDRFDLTNLLLKYIKNNFSKEAYQYILNHPMITNSFGKPASFQRFIFTRFIIRHLLICKARRDIPEVAEIFLDIDTGDMLTTWLDKMQTVVLIYCNEHKVFETFID